MKTLSSGKILVWSITVVMFLSVTSVFAMYDPQLMRFTSRDPIGGKFKEPITLHKYLYVANDPLNRIDPTGRFFDWIAQADDAVASAGAYISAKDKLNLAFTTLNGVQNGFMNMLTGPEGVSDKMKFSLGFAAGVIEMQVGMKFGAGYGAAASTAFLDKANSMASGKNIPFSRICFDAALAGSMAGSVSFADDVLTPFQMYLAGVGVQGGLWEANWGIDYITSLLP